MRRKWCIQCDTLVTAESDNADGRPDDTWSCTECGYPIQCGDCGAEWSGRHVCAPAE
jgi:hypothetical protein